MTKLFNSCTIITNVYSKNPSTFPTLLQFFSYSSILNIIFAISFLTNYIKMQYNTTMRLDYLQAQCRAKKLKTYGSKAILIKRLNDFNANSSNSNLNLQLEESSSNVVNNDNVAPITTVIVESIDDDDEIKSLDGYENNVSSDDGSGTDGSGTDGSSDERSSDDDNINVDDASGSQRKKRKKRVLPVYLIEKEFENIHLARAFVKTIIHDGDQAFSDSYRERATKGVGYKQFHNCRIDPSCCKKKVYILNHKNKESCSVWFSNVEHNHRETIIEQKANWGLTKVTRNEIEKLYCGGIKTATQIIARLRAMEKPFKNKVILEDTIF